MDLSTQKVPAGFLLMSEDYRFWEGTRLDAGAAVEVLGGQKNTVFYFYSRALGILPHPMLTPV